MVCVCLEITFRAIITLLSYKGQSIEIRIFCCCCCNVCVYCPPLLKIVVYDKKNLSLLVVVVCVLWKT